MKQLILPILLAFALAACGRSAPTHFYMLESGATAMQVESMPNTTLRVAEVDIPGYLQRNNIVSRVPGQNQLVLADFHLWAEPVNNGVRRVVEETLLQPMLAAGINLLPPGTEQRGDYTLLLDVQRLDGNFNQKAVLESWWTLLNREDKAVARGMYANDKIVTGDAYNDLAAAESALVRDFANYLAQKLPPHMTGRK